MATEPLRVTIAPELVEELQDWSAPVRLKVEDGELVCRHAGTPSPTDDDHWPRRLPALPIPDKGKEALRDGDR